MKDRRVKEYRGIGEYDLCGVGGYRIKEERRTRGARKMNISRLPSLR